MVRTTNRRRRTLAGLAAAAALAIPIAAGTASASTPRYPVTYDFLTGFAAGAATPGAPPPGADVGCRPGAAHPRPVVLVHGTFEDQADNWQALSPLLADEGYCVYSFDYGAPAGDPVQGTGDIAASAQQLAAFVDQVRGQTGAAKVDIVGHSQGGMMPRYYLRFLGGASKVGTLVGLSPSNHGTTASGILSLTEALPGGNALLGVSCTACVEQEAGSPFLTALDAGGDTVAGVRYVVIETAYDEVVTPYTSAFLTGPRVTDVLLQDQCPTDFSEHLTTPYDPVALHDVLDALDPATATPPTCVVVPPFVG